jgi:TolB-like protein/Tfp pilus assembly protein PilF
MSFFAELKRRNVFRVAIAYVIASWLLLQVTDVLVPILTLPEWAAKLIFLILLIGFIPALIFAWAFEMTPEGLKREAEVDRTQSIAPQTGRKLDRTIIMIMGVALLYFAADKFWLSSRTSEPVASPETVQIEEQVIPSIAVLPLADMSPQGDHEYFSDGLTEELLNILAKIKDLRVAGRTSSFAFKGKNEDLREIAKKLDVDSILEGSVRKDDQRNKVRITLQLINAEDGYHLWSETYDRDLDDIFTIQEEVANEVAKALKITLLGEEQFAVEHVAATDLNAYDLYLRGLQGLNENSYASLQQAEEDFQNALTLDPAYSPAQLGLVLSWLEQAGTGVITNDEGNGRALPLLTSILQREPGNSEAHVAMARILSRQGDREGAEREFRTALEIDDHNVVALKEFGSFLRNTERISEAMPFILRAAQIEPYSADIQFEICWSYTWLTKLQAALDACANARKIDPDGPSGYYGASMANRVAGDMANSVFWDVQGFGVDPDDHELQAQLAEQWLGLGDLKMAETWLERAMSSAPGEPATLAAQVTLLLYKEQATLAAQLAARSLHKPNRFFTRDVIRNAYVTDALKRGESRSALEAYRIDNEWFFEEPMQISEKIVSWGAGDLIELAFILKSAELTSSKADELLNAAETLTQNTHPDLTQWLSDINLAGIEATRGNKETALQHLRDAYDNGMRLRWRYRMQHWFVLEPLHGMGEYQQLVALFEQDMEHQLERTHELLAEESGP